MLKRSLSVVAGALALAGVVGLTAAGGADDPIAKRKELMKAIGTAAKTLGGMLESGFDGPKAAEAATLIAANAKEFPGYFPETSKEGGETTASPKIWEDMDEFKEYASDLATDAEATASAAAAGEAPFKEAANKMFGNCKKCHEEFRIKK